MRTKTKVLLAVFIVGIVISCTKDNLSKPSTNQALDNSIAKAAPHYIGESYGGGIIFALNSFGHHGLIAAVADQGKATWLNDEYTVTGATEVAIGTGRTNTLKIHQSQGVPGNYAARKCVKYNGGGYTDWFLPSEKELRYLYKQREVVGGFEGSGFYWSSSENDWYAAAALYFYNGLSVYPDKADTGYVRAIRYF